MMEHPTEQEWIGYQQGERANRERLGAHLEACDRCRGEFAEIEAVFAAMAASPAPDPGDGYEQRLWQQLAPRLSERPAAARWWQGLLVPRRALSFAALGAVIVLAFLAGRGSKGPLPGTGIAALDPGKVRERVLVVAVGDHLGRSEMVLMELENARPAQAGQRTVDISATQQRAEGLLEENRLYRQTALHDGDQGMASTLDELERVLLDIANSPDAVTPAQFESLRKRIEDRGILFKVRVVNQDLQERRTSPKSPPARSGPAPEGLIQKEGNKI